MKYEVTITLKPLMYQYTPREQHDRCKNILFDIFEPFQVSCTAELTKEHNVHYHSIVELADLQHKDRFLNRFRKHCKIFGKKSCSPVMWEDSLRDYIKKDIDITREITGDPIIRDSFGVFKCLF